MFFKKPKYPLPKFPPTVIGTFNKLISPLSESQRSELRSLLEKFIEKFRDETNQCSARRPVAEQLYDRSRLILDTYENHSTKMRPYIGAAVRYVVLADDPFSDETFLTGLDDDVRVMNHVLEKLNLLEDIIVLES